MLAHNFRRPLIRAQAEIDRMAHFAGARPFGEFHLGYKLRPDPGGNSLILYF